MRSSTRTPKCRGSLQTIDAPRCVGLVGPLDRQSAPLRPLGPVARRTYNPAVRLLERTGALGERNFRLFFIGRATSQIGNGMGAVAVTFAVLAHGNAIDVGLVASAGLVPVVLLLLIGGVIGDRRNRRLIMLSSDALRMFVEVGLGAWILFGRPPLWAFMGDAAIVGACSALFSPALQGLVPQLVSREKLQQANAFLGLSGSITGIMGPPIAGAIIAVSNPGWAVLIDGLTYLASVISLYLISMEWTPTQVTESFLHQLRQGWTEFWSRTWLWVIVVEFSMVNVLESGTTTVLGPVIAKQSLGGAPAWGGVLAIGGLGAVAGGIVMLHWRPLRPMRTATIVCFGFALPMLTLAYRDPLWAIAGTYFIASIGSAIFGTLWSTTMQREIPSELLSRLSAYDMFGSFVFLPIGLALVGPIAKAVGERTTLVGSSLILVVLIAATLAVPAVWSLPSSRTATGQPEPPPLPSDSTGGDTLS
jgi:MFS family permease